MKTISTFIICLAFAASAFAQNTGKSHPEQRGMGDKSVPGYSKNACAYSAVAQDGKITVQQNGTPLKGEIQVAPSVKITSDGKLTKKEGAERMLEAGNCISEKGTITMRVE